MQHRFIRIRSAPRWVMAGLALGLAAASGLMLPPAQTGVATLVLIQILSVLILINRRTAFHIRLLTALAAAGPLLCLMLWRADSPTAMQHPAFAAIGLGITLGLVGQTITWLSRRRNLSQTAEKLTMAAGFSLILTFTGPMVLPSFGLDPLQTVMLCVIILATRDLLAQGLPAPFGQIATALAIALIIAAGSRVIAADGQTQGTLTIAAILLLHLMIQNPRTPLISGFVLVSMAPPILSDLKHQPVLLGLLATAVLLSRPSRPEANAAPPLPAGLGQALAAMGSWILRIDREEKKAWFPFGLTENDPKGRLMPFDHIFTTGVAELLPQLSGPASEAVQISLPPMTVHLSPQTAAKPVLVDGKILTAPSHTAWLVLRDITERAQLSERLALQEHRLAEAMLREERLLSVASHELRTPIASLSLLSEELNAGRAWTDISERFEPVMARLLSILTALKAEGITSGEAQKGQSFTLSGIAQTLLEDAADVARQHRIDLHLSLPEVRDHPLRGDMGRISMTLSRLIDNAIRHSGGTHVTLGAILLPTGTGATLCWHVRDNGKGLTDRRFQAAMALDTTQPSLPGLSVAWRNAIALHGTLGLQDVSSGTCICLTHPIALDDTSTMPPIPREADRQIPPAPPSPAPLQNSVLLIEDNRLVGEITSSRLTRLFHRVDWAETGEDGLQRGLSGSYDMIFIDHLLPGLNGDEIVAHLRRAGLTVPIIGVTASTLGVEEHALVTAGATLVLEKPLSFERMKTIVATHCPTARASPD